MPRTSKRRPSPVSQEQAYLMRAMAGPRPGIRSGTMALAAAPTPTPGGMTPAMRDRASRLRSHRPYATRTYPGWDNLGDVHGALNQLERGDFYQASIMADQMWRSPRFHGVARTRLNALATIPLDIKAPNERGKAQRIATALGGLEEGPTPWDRMFPAAEVAKLVKWGLLIGIGVGELIWTTTEEENGELGFINVADGVDYRPPVDLGFINVADGVDYRPPVDAKGLRKGRIIWTPRLRVWHPQFLRWDESRERYVMQTMDGQVELPDIESNQHSDGHWIVWTPFGYRDAWLEGLVRGMAEIVMDSRWNKGDWSRYNERYGKPVDKVVAPRSWTKEEKETLLETVSGRNADAAFLAEKDSDDDGGLGVDLELIEAKSTGWDTFKARGEANDTDIAILWLGQNLTTAVSGGSLAAEQGHELVRRDLLKSDAHVVVCLRDQALWHFVKLNYWRPGDPELTPIPNYRVDPPEDQVAKATAQQALATTIGALVLARQTDAGAVPVDFRKLLEDSNIIPVMSQEEADAIEAAAAEEDAMAAEDAARAAAGATGQSGEGGGQLALAAADAPLPKGVVKRRMYAGLSIAIETPAGTYREWHDAAGNQTGRTLMHFDYGYIEGVKGADKEEVDCYLGPDETAKNVHIVHQARKPDYKAYDEDKCFIGWNSADEARRAYVLHRDDGDAPIMSISTIPLDRFKAMLAKRKPTDTSKIHAGARHRSILALRALVEKSARDLIAMRGGKGPTKLEYADKLTRKTIPLAAKLMARDLAAVKDEIGKATSFEDLKERVIKRYAGMDPKALARLVEQARLMSTLAGQLSAVKET